MHAKPTFLTLFAVAAAVGAVLVPSPPVEAAEFWVNTLSDNPADGYTLREAIDDANSNPGLDTIRFSPALDGGTIVLNGTSLSIEDDLEIMGEDLVAVTASDVSSIFISFWPGTNLTIRDIVLEDGWSAGNGGAINFFQGNDLVLDGVTITGSTATDNGGAVSVNSTTGTTDIVNSTMSGNDAVFGDGGAVWVSSVADDVDVAYSSFVDNATAHGDGGGLRVDAPSDTFRSSFSQYIGNEAATGDGGGLFARGSFVEVEGGSFVDNRAAGSYGGVRIRSAPFNALISNVTIEGNEATSGSAGGGHFESNGDVGVDSLTVTNNTAGAYAGVTATSGSIVWFRNSRFEGNESQSIGGGLTVAGVAILEIEETTIAGNVAPLGAGLVVDNAGDTLVDRTTISGNNATFSHGGGIVVDGAPGQRIELRSSTVSGNDAATTGAGIFSNDVEVTAFQSTIVDNHAAAIGGGVFQDGVAEFTADQSVVAANTAPSFPDMTGPVLADHAAFGDTSGVTLLVGSNHVEVADPGLGSLQDNGGDTLTHLPDSDSPLLDAGPAAPFPAGMTDQRGEDRMFGEAVDIGSVERNAGDDPPPPPPPPPPVEPPPMEPPPPPVEPPPVEPPPVEPPPAEVGGDTALWIPVQPARVFDSRPGSVTVDGVDQATGRLDAGEEVRVRIAGRAGVADDSIGMIANVSAVGPGGTGYYTVHPCSQPRPVTASLNFTSGVNLGDEVIALLDDGDICVFTSESTHLTIDVVGFIPAGSQYEARTPARLMDTRSGSSTVDGDFAGVGRLEAGDTIEVDVAERAGVTDDAEAVVVYLGAVRGDQSGFVTAWDCADERPLASSLNFVAGVNRGNEVVVAPSASGSICLYVSAQVDLTLDVVGAVPASDAQLLLLDEPSRLLDTRAAGSTIDGVGAGGGRTAAGEVIEVQIAGRAGVDTGASTITANLTAVQGGQNGWATVYPCTPEVPYASSLNFVPGVNGGNELVASLDDDGKLCVFTSVDTHLTIDVTAFTVG